MKVKVNQVLEVAEKMSRKGKSYHVTSFTDEENKLYKDVYGKFEQGQEIDGEWKTDEYGTKFEVARQSTGAGGRFSDPETRKEITRQNALTNAVAFCSMKASLMEKADGIKYLSGKQIIQVATYFAAYSQGRVTVVSKPDEAIVEPVDTPLPILHQEFSDQELDQSVAPTNFQHPDSLV